MRVVLNEIRQAVNADNDADGSVYRQAVEAAEKAFAHAAANNLPFMLFTVFPDRVDLDTLIDSNDAVRCAETLISMLESSDVIHDLLDGKKHKES